MISVGFMYGRVFTHEQERMCNIIVLRFAVILVHFIDKKPFETGTKLYCIA